ncbi:hypothetical protein LTR84_002409 [Exophiala bonariae]|uniref:Helicase ATP-binding domain-containing protein n=1 Tax=Exophiala bonariae TaxID=1690606 RepID=A0AAV9NDD3_9EURO|nr:hypothetical protein LTR84_002409 [Exophiala bonariae]
MVAGKGAGADCPDTSALPNPVPKGFVRPKKAARIYGATKPSLRIPEKETKVETLRGNGNSALYHIVLAEARKQSHDDNPLLCALQVEDPETAPEANRPLNTDEQKAGNKNTWNGLVPDSSVPLRNIDDIFDHITTKAREFGLDEAQSPFIQDNSRIRIVTMCSGTDSPLIALNMVQRSLQRQGQAYFKFNHLASCEIEPFKQAFIERNFSPPNIFHDVTEFTDHKAEPDNPEKLPRNAYGATPEIPKDVHILIAGSSCVDYSGLNNNPNKEHGESTNTLTGVADYADKYRPVIILLENVANADWKTQNEIWEPRNYFFRTVRVDSKNFYIPQTRERGYSFAVDMDRVAKLYGRDKVEDVCQDLYDCWLDYMGRFQRRASTPYTEFLLDADDARLHIAKAMTEDRKVNKLNTDWKSCQTRHIRERAEKFLGTKRPFTNRESGGRSKLSDHAWQKWSFGSSTREQDMLDITMLRSVSERDIDITSKSRVLDISQNVDRETDNRAWGIVGCITPSGTLFETSRAGPLVGLETLALQGMPIDNLDLTKATLKQLTNLAGNAMTTTVIGASILSTLIACHQLSTDRRRTPASSLNLFQEYIDNHVRDPIGKTGFLEYQDVNFENSSVLEFSESLQSLNVNQSAQSSWQTIVKEAEASQRLCACENLGEHTTTDVKYCHTCFYTVCNGGDCSRTPHDNFEILKVDHASRGATDAFIERLIRNFPGTVKFSLQNNDENQNTEDEFFLDPSDGRRTLLNLAFHFTGVQYGATWKVLFESSIARLELEFARDFQATSKAHHSNLALPQAFKIRPVWLLFEKHTSSLVNNSIEKDNFIHPIARMYPKLTCFDGNWEFWRGPGGPVGLKVRPSNTCKVAWEAKLGLQGDLFPKLRIPDQLTVSATESTSYLSESEVESLHNVIGSYKLVEKCPAPYGRLYVRQSPGGSRHCPVFFYMKSGHLQDAIHDRMEFSKEPPSLISTDDRNLLLRLKDRYLPTFRESEAKPQATNVTGVLFNTWMKVGNLSLKPMKSPAKFFVQRDSSFITQSGDCKDSLSTVFLAKWIPREHLSQYPEGKSTIVPLEDKPGALKDFSWMRIAAAKVPQLALGWIYFSDQSHAGSCSEPDFTPDQHTNSEEHSAEGLKVVCAPKPPRLQWVEFRLKVGDGKTKPEKKLIEDAKAAHDYEKALKSRPVPILAIIHCKAGELSLQILLNPVALLHRARAELAFSEDKIYSQWRLCYYPPFSPRPKFPRLRLLSNMEMALAPSNPRLFKQLWDSQRKTLTWMIDCESSKSLWVEEALKETCIPALGWRLEVKASRNLVVRGGVLADKVGSGKTITTLELVRRDLAKPLFPHESIKSHISTDATLIIVPKNLLTQWEETIREVMGATYSKNSTSGRLIVLREPRNITKFSVGAIRKARIVLVSLSVFEHNDYWQEHRMVACAPNVPEKAGRAFDEYLDDSLSNLSKFIKASDDWKDINGFWKEWSHAKCKIGNYNRFSGVKTRKSKKAEYKATMLNAAVPGTRKRSSSCSSASSVSSASSQTSSVGPPQKKSKGQSAVPQVIVKAPKEANKVWIDASTEAFMKGEKADFEEEAKEFQQNKDIAPVLHMFNFRRLVVDEFTYAKPLTLSTLLRIKSSSRWMLSGTPPIHDYDSVNTIAKLLGTKISTFDEHKGTHGFTRGPSPTDRLKSLSEEFAEHQGIGSPAFIKYLYGRAQDFSNTFIRQDDCSEPKQVKSHELQLFIGSIPELVDHVEVNHIMTYNDCRFNVNLTPARRNKMTFERLREALRESHTGPRAASVCSMTDLAASRQPEPYKHNKPVKPMKLITPEDILKETKEKIIKLSEDLLQELQELFYCKRSTHKEDSYISFRVFLKDFYRLDLHSLDPSVIPIIDRLISYASENEQAFEKLHVTIAAKKPGVVKKEEQEEKIKARIEQATDAFGKLVPHYQRKEVDQRTVKADNLVGDIVDTCRRLQFIIVAKAVNEKKALDKCSACGNIPDSSDEIEKVEISGVCGHIVRCAACPASLPKALERCPNEYCSAEIGQVWAGDFFSKSADAQQSSLITVTRMIKAVDMIKAIPDDEFVLVFGQFKDMETQFMVACHTAGISYEDGTRNSAMSIARFKRKAEQKVEGAPKVLLLQIDSEDAAGWNLQCANHVVFLAPFVGDSVVQAWDTMVQAVGRAHRPGQKKKVQVYHIYGAKTIEEKMTKMVVKKFQETP